MQLARNQWGSTVCGGSNNEGRGPIFLKKKEKRIKKKGAKKYQKDIGEKREKK